MEDPDCYAGRLAYEAYCATTNWKSAVTGVDLPMFYDQKRDIRLGWINAARAVKSLPPLDKLPGGNG